MKRDAKLIAAMRAVLRAGLAVEVKSEPTDATLPKTTFYVRAI